MTSLRLLPVLLCALALVACEPSGQEDRDAGEDAGTGDAGTSDAGFEQDAGVDAGVEGVESFREAYRWESSGSCTGQRWNGSAFADPGILGYAPADTTAPGARYPLFIYSVGTWDTYDNPVVHRILAIAAAQGFVAVSAQYDNNFLFSCDELDRKARCLYDASQPGSVAAKLCARTNVDCDRGIVVAGHSQGSQVSLRAANWNTATRAAVGAGATCDYVGSFGGGDTPGLCSATAGTGETCLLDANTALPGDRMLLVSGQNESVGAQGEYERQTGKVCAPGTAHCLNANGSGWIVVGNAEVNDGDADHSFFVDNGGSTLDPGFAPPAREAWSLLTLVDWLKGFTDP